ncbi:MAG: tetratricopeptide repeat protein, partial [Planctomycetia bacterium]
MDAPSPNQRGLQFIQQRRYDEALACFEESLQRNPADDVALNNLGNTLKHLGRPEEAEAAFQRALAVTPNDAGLHMNLAEVFKAQGRIADALAVSRRALDLPNAAPGLHSNYLLTLLYDPAISPDDVLTEHVGFGFRSAAPWPTEPYQNPPDAPRPLRGGYLSPDFRRHAAASFFLPILQHHDKKNFTVHLYGEVPTPDDATEWMKRQAAAYTSTVNRSAAEVAAQIQGDRIDLLVDLAGHTANNRLDVLARRPAPVQITYLGYPDTTGLPAVDYRLTDAVLNPPDEPNYATERLVRLPGCFATFAPPNPSPPVAPPPVLRNGYVTFGSHHQLF